MHKLRLAVLGSTGSIGRNTLDVAARHAQHIEVVALAAEGLLILAYMCIFNSIDRVLVMAMRGAGKSVVPMVTAQLGAFSRIPLAYFLAHKTGSYMGIFYSMLIANGIRSGSIALYSLFGGWKWALNSYEKKHAEEKAAMIAAGTLEDE